MAIRVALHHRTSYLYSRPIQLGPQIVRLRPAPHCRTPVLSYSLSIQPSEHFCNWQQDPQGNYLARLIFNEPAKKFEVTVDLIVDMSSINPFDFFLEDYANEFPFVYETWQANELAPFLRIDPSLLGPTFEIWKSKISLAKLRTIDKLMELNQLVQRDIEYCVRLEPDGRAHV